MPTTSSPASASSSATCSPPGPRPTTTASTSTDLQPAPVGDLHGRHNRGPDVELNLVVVAQRDVVRVAGVQLGLLAGRCEEDRHVARGRADLRLAEGDAPLVEKLTQGEALRGARRLNVDDPVVGVHVQPVEAAPRLDEGPLRGADGLAAGDPDAVGD